MAPETHGQFGALDEKKATALVRRRCPRDLTGAGDHRLDLGNHEVGRGVWIM